MDPLVITLDLDEPTTTRFERERAELFPAGRTQVGAHLTLFHAVPGEMREQVLHDVRVAAGRPAFDLRVGAVVALGRGAAYGLEAGELVDLHRELQQRWAGHLTRQDQQPLKAHVTVQNKVDADLARRTVDRLRRSFEPFTACGEALHVWRYAGGPWESVELFPFDPPPKADR